MAYKAINCPNCGAAITSIPDRGSFFCRYCGAKIEKDKTFIEVSGNVTVAGMASVASLLERGFMFLDDGDFDNADMYFDRVLDADPHCSRAYLGKCLVDIRAENPDALLIGYYNPVEKNEYFQKALRFANDEEYDELMLIKQHNTETHGLILQSAQEAVQKAEQMLVSFNQYYAKHRYSHSRYITEICLFSLVTTIVIAIAVIPVVGIFAEGPSFIVICAPFAGAGFGLYCRYKKIKDKKALGEQLDRDRVRLAEELESKKSHLAWVINEWNK